MIPGPLIGKRLHAAIHFEPSLLCPPMTTSGLIVMLISVGTVVVLFGWCIYKVLTTPHEAEKIHGTEFETPDIRQDRDA